MTPKDLATYVRKKTRTDASSFPDTLLLIYANIAKNEICEKIKKTSEDYFGLELTRDITLVEGRKYGISTAVLNGIKLLEAKIDNVKYKRLIPYDLTKLGIATDEDNIVDYMAGRPWGYFIFGAQFYLLSAEPIIAVADGLKMWANVYPSDLDDMTSVVDMSTAPSNIEFGIPITMHELVARRMIIEYKTSQEKPIPLSEKENVYEVDLAEKIKLLTSFNIDESVIPEPAYNDDGNAGADF